MRIKQANVYEALGARQCVAHRRHPRATSLPWVTLVDTAHPSEKVRSASMRGWHWGVRTGPGCSCSVERLLQL